MRRMIACIAAVLMITGCFAACDNEGTQSTQAGLESSLGERKPIQVVTTIFPEYDWVMNVLGDNPAGIQVSLLLDNGVDLHSFQPSVEDILKIAACDVLVYVGGESDEWVADALQEALNDDMVVINLLEELGEDAKAEEVVEGMQEADRGHMAHAEDEEAEYDEHVWLSLRNAKLFVNAISQVFQTEDPVNAAAYGDNAAAYVERLDDLDMRYQAAVDEAASDTLVFGDRFPFRYLVDDYGLSYYAAFSGCSAETEASFETIMFLANKLDELSLKSIMVIDGSDKRVADTIVRNTRSKDQDVLVLDSLQSIDKKQIESDTTYISVMEKNLGVLKEALVIS